MARIHSGSLGEHRRSAAIVPCGEVKTIAEIQAETRDEAGIVRAEIIGDAGIVHRGRDPFADLKAALQIQFVREEQLRANRQVYIQHPQVRRVAFRSLKVSTLVRQQQLRLEFEALACEDREVHTRKTAGNARVSGIRSEQGGPLGTSLDAHASMT